MQEIQKKQAALPSIDQLIPHIKAAMDQVSDYVIKRIEEYALQNEKSSTRLNSMKKSLQSNFQELTETKEEWQIPIFKQVAESISQALSSTKINPLKIDGKAMGQILWDYIQGNEQIVPIDEKEENVLFKSGKFVIPKTHQIQHELYLKGFECQYKNHFKLAIEIWEQSAAHGNAGALAALGYGYQEFKDIQNDQKKGVEMLEQGAAQGSAVAVNSLAFCYEFGIGVAQSKEKARTLYEIAANRGSASACHNLALTIGSSNQKLTALYLKRAEDLSVKDLVEVKDLLKF